MREFDESLPRIEGEKIAFWFGSVVCSRRGSRDTANLGLNGEAVVLKRLKRAAAAMGTSGPQPRIRCESAFCEADDIELADQKVEYGSHRAFQGKALGRAWCHVTVPSRREQR